MRFETPILFLIFNRPDQTTQVFEIIKELKPRYLYIAADGPRRDNENDRNKCAKVKSIVNNIDWPCQVKRLYREENLGCKLAVSQSITWFFEHVEEGIILEDDIVPNPSFFSFCASMLERYKNDQRVMHIAGFNLLGTWRDQIQSYHFSYFGTIWGWATWRRSWKFYDVSIKKWSDPNTQKKILHTYFPQELREDKKLLYDKLYREEIDTWDYQWTFCRLLHEGLSIVPAKNLILNIGFDLDATHTPNAPDWAPKVTFNLQPPFVYKGTVAADNKYEVKHLRITNRGIKQSSIRNKLKNIYRVFMRTFNAKAPKKIAAN